MIVIKYYAHILIVINVLPYGLHKEQLPQHPPP